MRLLEEMSWPEIEAGLAATANGDTACGSD